MLRSILPAIALSYASLQALELQLPTANQALFTQNGGPNYFQFVDRNFEGKVSYPWEGGQFGFWRDPRRLSSGGLAYARFHEGMDVKPLKRDAAGNPLDEVQAILPGEVVHAAPAGQSNYGSYLVLRHDWGEGPFYSLYAHLSRSQVQKGEKVRAGQVIATMGYTGSGIDQRRAHVHVELNILLSSDFEAWHTAGFRTPNHHGIYNGMNLLGLDLQSLYSAHKRQPDLRLAEWIQQTSSGFEVAVPGRAKMDLLQRYPWLKKTSPSAAETATKGWLIRCTPWGFPIQVSPAQRDYSGAEVTWLAEGKVPPYYRTRGLLNQSGKLTVEGLRFMQLLAGF